MASHVIGLGGPLACGHLYAVIDLPDISGKVNGTIVSASCADCGKRLDPVLVALSGTFTTETTPE